MIDAKVCSSVLTICLLVDKNTVRTETGVKGGADEQNIKRFGDCPER